MKQQIILFLSILFVSSVVFAEDFTNCAINDIRFGSNDANFHVLLDCTVANVPVCATADTYVAVNRGTESGKQKMSALMLAFTAGYKLRGKVKQSCPSWQNNVAELEWVVIMR